MQLRDIKPGRWYDTASGIGQCVSAGNSHPVSVQIKIVYPFPRGIINLKPRNVLNETIDPTPGNKT